MSCRGPIVIAMGVLLFLLGALSHGAAAFQDPLSAPAVMSPKAQSSRLQSVARAGARLVAVGRLGHILISEDAGKSWKQVSCPVRSDLVSVRFVTPSKGWAVGFDGVVLHSGDGGLTWTKQLDGNQAAKLVQDYFQKRAAEGDAAAKQMLPEAERAVVDGADKALFDVLFLNEKDGFVVGAFNHAFRTRDGGATWEPFQDRTENPRALHLYALAVVGEQMYLAGEQGLLRRWNKYADRFESLDTPYKGSFFGLLVKQSMIFAFGMRGNAFRSSDGGVSWQKLDTSTTWGINAATLLDDGRLVIVTDGREILVSKDDGISFERLKTESPRPYYGVVAAGATGMVLVGAAGVRLESTKQDSEK